MAAPPTEDFADCGPGVRRAVVDASDVRWEVWRCVPAGSSTGLSASFAAGWLTFETPAGEKRRYAPAPDDWRTMPEAGLRELLARARPSRSRAGGAPR